MIDNADNAVQKLKEAWNAPRRPIADWIPKVQDAYMSSGLGVADASEEIESTEAELEAVLRLGLLEPNMLNKISLENPPMTTWLLLSEISSEDIPKVLEAAKRIPNAPSDYQRVAAAIREVTGGASVTAVQHADADHFEFALSKAEAYEVWPHGHKNYGALRGFAKRRRSGRPLTAPQTAYAKGLLIEIVDSGAIRVPSPDDDGDQCSAIIELIA